MGLIEIVSTSFIMILTCSILYYVFFHNTSRMLKEIRNLKHYMQVMHRRDPDYFNIWLELFDDGTGYLVYNMNNATQREIESMQRKVAKLNLHYPVNLQLTKYTSAEPVIKGDSV